MSRVGHSAASPPATPRQPQPPRIQLNCICCCFSKIVCRCAQQPNSAGFSSAGIEQKEAEKMELTRKEEEAKDPQVDDKEQEKQSPPAKET